VFDRSFRDAPAFGHKGKGDSFMKGQVEEQLTEVFRDVFEDDGIVVARGLTADKVDGWDSLTHVRLLLTIERKFAVKISAMEAGKLKTVGDLLDLLHTKLGEQKS